MLIDTNPDIRPLIWAEERLGGTFKPDRCRWVAGLDAGGPVFVVVYSHFSSRNCELSIATDETKRWATKKALRAIFSMPFVEWHLPRVTFVVSAENLPSQDLVLRLGAKLEGRVREAFPEGDGLVFGMLRLEAEKWIGKNDEHALD